MPALRCVAALEEPDYPVVEEQRSGEVIRFKPDNPKARGQINNINWRTDLLELARLLDHLAPAFHNPASMFRKTLWRPSCADWHGGQCRGARR